MAKSKPMKTIIKFLGAVILGAGLFISGCAKKQTASLQSLKNPEVAAQLKSFVAEKEAQESGLVEADEKNYGNENYEFKRTDCRPFFDAAAKGDWQTVTNLFSGMKKQLWNRTNTVELRGRWWQPVMETYGAIEQFALGDEKYATAFGDDIIKSIPAGSIYFGGTDPGRFIITAMCKSQANGDPFFTLTQNALADGAYLDYVRSIYGDKIKIPTREDSQKTFQDYIADAQLRLKDNKLKPGEDVKVTDDGRMQVSGQVAVMTINGLLVKIIFDKNPGREFYIEESFPLDWMYPHLEPHGLIMKINRQPLPELSDEILERDHDYWAKLVQPMIGDWLHDDTSVKEIAAFAKKTFGKQDFSGFTGDPRFIQNAYSHRMFSKLRSSIAGLYAWRLKQAADASEKERMAREADFAFRQAWALCPDSPEAIFRYVNLLIEQKRGADALLVAEIAAQMPANQGKDGEQIRGLVEQLKKFQKAK
jgi:hypothetical protein